MRGRSITNFGQAFNPVGMSDGTTFIPPPSPPDDDGGGVRLYRRRKRRKTEKIEEIDQELIRQFKQIQEDDDLITWLI